MPPKRRIPKQERGREKYDLILSVAESLIGKLGNDAVSMREIAKQAGIAPSSIYQYFPDKNAVLSAIMLDNFEEVNQQLAEQVLKAGDISQFIVGLENSIDYFYQLFKHNPALATIWAGVQANPVLHALDIDDTLKNARVLSVRLCQILPESDPQEAFNSCLLLIQMIGVTVRMVLTMDEPDGKQLVQEYKTLVKLRLCAFITP